MQTLILTIFVSNLLPTWIARTARWPIVALPAILLWALGVLMVLLALFWPDGAWLRSNPVVRQMIEENIVRGGTTLGSDGSSFQVLLSSRNGNSAFEVDAHAVNPNAAPGAKSAAEPTAVQVLGSSLWTIWLVGVWTPLFAVQLILLWFKIWRENKADHRHQKRRRRVQILSS